jgi:hypothetical protein
VDVVDNMILELVNQGSGAVIDAAVVGRALKLVSYMKLRQGNLAFFDFGSTSDGDRISGLVEDSQLLCSHHYEGSRREAARLLACVAHSKLVKITKLQQIDPAPGNLTLLHITYEVVRAG